MANLNKKIVLWGFLGYFWTLIDDDPVNADLLLGKTGYTMEFVLHALTIFFFYLAIREAAKRVGLSWTTALWIVLAFLSSSADDAAFINLISLIRHDYWYPLDVAEHAASLLFFYLAIRVPIKKWRYGF